MQTTMNISARTRLAALVLAMAFPSLLTWCYFVWLAGRASEGLRQAYLGAALALQAALWIMWVLMRWVA